MNFRLSFDPAADEPGVYRKIVDNSGKAISAYIMDTGGHYLSLQKHTINPDGSVIPSVGCSILGCGFHEYIKLVGW